MGDFFGAIGHGILNVVLPSLATVIAGLLVMVLKRVAKKYGLEVTEKQEERLKQIVVDKIHATEEAARRAPSISGEEKKAITIGAVMDEAERDPTIPNPSIATVAAKVDAELAKARSPFLPNPGLPGLGRR